MTTHLIYQGFAVGFLAAIPLGPMGMVCVQRTLTHGPRVGLVSAAGLTLAAAFWCVAAAQGLSAVAGVFVGREAMVTVTIGAFLVLAGFAGLTSGRQQIQAPASSVGRTLVGHFLTSLVGVLLNPVTFVTMTAVLALLGGVRTSPGIEGLAWLAAAVFLGGMSVWIAITQGVTVMRNHLGEQGGARISQALNACILLLGILYLVRPLFPPLVG